MGLFGIFGKKEKKESAKATPPTSAATRVHSASLKPQKTALQSQEDKSFDRDLKKLQSADADYKNDKDLEKVIQTYQSVLNGCTWNAFNYQKKLASYYVKAERYNDAWKTLQQAQKDSVQRGHGKATVGQIRLEQFKVLKAEKKYKEALDILCRAYVINNAPYGEWNRDSFIKTAKTCAKGLGLTDQQLFDLADVVEKSIKSKDVTEAHIRQAISPLLK